MPSSSASLGPAHFVQSEDGMMKELLHLQLNFYGVKQDAPDARIRVRRLRAISIFTASSLIAIDNIFRLSKVSQTGARFAFIRFPWTP